MLLENGKYRAVVKDVNLHFRGENERLTAAFRLLCEGKDLVHREWLELNDGTISDKTIKRLRACFPKWDGSIETLEQGFCVQDVEVEVTVENEQDKQDPDKWWTRTRFMDPPGGGSGSAAMPERANPAAVVSKYGARFRALAGGTPARSVEGRVSSDGKAPSPPAPEPSARCGAGLPSPAGGEGAAQAGRAPQPPPKAPAPQVAARASSLEACWEALCKKHPDLLREQLSEQWFQLLERVVPEKDQADFLPEDWGKVLVAIELPF